MFMYIYIYIYISNPRVTFSRKLPRDISTVTVRKIGYISGVIDTVYSE